MDGPLGGLEKRTMRFSSFARRQGWIVHPASLTGVVLVFIVAWVIVQDGGNPLALARLGTVYSLGDPQGTQGYDGQFVYYISRDLRPAAVMPFLDIPAYRYQRILLPLLARGIALGQEVAIPWTLVFLGILSQIAGTWAIAEFLAGRGINRWYALAYGLFAGFTLAVRLDLPEPMAYALVAGGFLAMESRRNWIAWLLFGLALFAKEVTVIFVIAMVLFALQNRRWNDLVGLSLFAILPFALFQLWLWKVFGQPGLGSGGAMATPFELIPFMGLIRIGLYSPIYLMAMLVVFGPAIVLPALWGLWVGAKKWFSGEADLVVFALLLNSLVIPFLPFSTFRETGGLLRFACGLALSVILTASRYRMWKVLNYSQLWLVLNVFLLKS